MRWKNERERKRGEEIKKIPVEMRLEEKSEGKNGREREKERRGRDKER